MQLSQYGSLRMKDDSLPSYTDLRYQMTPIEHQEQMNTCTANAYAGACEYILKRYLHQNIDVSRMFIYYNARMIQRQSLVVTDNGTSLESVALGLHKFGVCDEYIWPYDFKLLNETPPAHVYETANQMIVHPSRISLDLTAMKTCLANQFAFLIAIQWTPQASEEIKRYGGYVLMPNPNDPQVILCRTHAVLVVGYN